MSSWVVLTVFASFSMWFSQAKAAACAEICYTTELTGFGPGGAAGCTCSGSSPTRSGAGGCSCGQCYDETNGAVIGYAVNSDGTCMYGTNCGDCTRSLDSSSSTSTTSTSSTATNPTPSTTSSSSPTTTTDAPATASSVPSSRTSSNATTNTDQKNSPTPTNSSSSDDNNADETAGSSAADTSNSNGLKTWQIALIICCGVLFFTVAVVAVLSCYCKARNRLYENEDNQADASYYQQQYPREHSDVIESGTILTPTLFPTSTCSHQRSGSSGSLTNETKPMYVNSANSSSSDRLGTGLASVHTRSSSGDLAGNSYPNAGSYSNQRILSGSYPIDRRPSSSNKSQGRQLNLEPRYSATRDREPLAVEL